MNQVKTNKWSLYQDSEIWEYSFSAEIMKQRGKTYPELLRAFIVAFHESGLSSLKFTDKEKQQESFLNVLDSLIIFLEELKLKNPWGRYPKISTTSIYNGPQETSYMYCFDNSLYVFDKEGRIKNVRFLLREMPSLLEEINHGQINYTGLSLPFEFYSRKMPDDNVKSYDFVLSFNSDIWLDEVPCIHCDDDDVKHDNRELAVLNRNTMNNFLSQMKQVCTDFGGEMIVEQENLNWLYQGKFGENGFIL